MSFDAVKYVKNRFPISGTYNIVVTPALRGGFSGCCGANAAFHTCGNPANKGIQLYADSKIEFSPQFKNTHEDLVEYYKGQYSVNELTNLVWPNVEFHEEDLTELVGQPLKYQVVVQKEFTKNYNSNQEKQYVKA